MARYEHLPIYKQALDAAVHFEQVVAGFSRYHKYTLGTEIRNQSPLHHPHGVRAAQPVAGQDHAGGAGRGGVSSAVLVLVEIARDVARKLIESQTCGR